MDTHPYPGPVNTVCPCIPGKENNKRTTDKILLRDKSPGPAVNAVVPVVTKDKITLCRNLKTSLVSLHRQVYVKHNDMTGTGKHFFPLFKSMRFVIEDHCFLHPGGFKNDLPAIYKKRMPFENDDISR